MNGTDPAGAPLPVTVLVSRTARERGDDELTAWADGLCRDAARMPGHLAAHVDRTQAGDRIVVRIGVTFASAADLVRWERSADRSRRLAEVDAIAEGPPVALSVDDLERWGLAARPPGRAPSRPRSAIFIWMALFPPALLMNALVIPGIAGWPVLARTLLLTLVLVPVVVYVTLPLVNRISASAVRPGRRSSAAAPRSA
jgi:uncharacterized protein